MEWKAITSVLGVIGMVCGGLYWFYKNIAKPSIKFIRGYEKTENKEIELEKYKYFSSYIDKKVDGIVQLSEVPLFICNSEGLCTLANIKLCELFGATEAQMKGYGWINYIHDDDKERARVTWEQLIHSGGEDIETDYRIVHGKTMETIHVTYHAIISRNEIGEVMVSVGKAKKK